MLSKYIVVILFLFLFFNAVGREQAVKKKAKNFNTKGIWWSKVRNEVAIQRRLDLGTLNALSYSFK